MLDVDAASFTVWRYRGLAPQPEPPFFRGSALIYRVDRIAAWLAQRLGLPYDADAAWRAAINRLVHEPGKDVRQAVRQWLEWLGPQASAPDRRQWLAGGFERYQDSVLVPLHCARTC
jgi:hypothetical protein